MTPLLFDDKAPIQVSRISAVVDLTALDALGEPVRKFFVVVSAAGKLGSTGTAVTICTDVETSSDGENWQTTVPGTEVLVDTVPVNGAVMSTEIPLTNPYPIGGIEKYLVRLNHKVQGGSITGSLYSAVTGQPLPRG